MCEVSVYTVDVTTAARMMGVTPQRVYQLVRAGVLEAYGGKIAIPLDAMREYQERRADGRDT